MLFSQRISKTAINQFITNRSKKGKRLKPANSDFLRKMLKTTLNLETRTAVVPSTKLNNK